MDRETEAPPRLAPLDDLGRRIQQVLDLVKPREADPPRPAYRGYGYSASEAYLHLSRELQPERELRVQKLGKGPGSHWWLVVPDGRIIDLALAAADRRDHRDGVTGGFPYEEGRGAMFRTGAHKPSKRAAAIIELVRSRA